MPRKKGTALSAATQPMEHLSFCSGSTTLSAGSLPSVRSEEFEFDSENAHEYTEVGKLEAEETGLFASGFGASADSSVASNATVKAATREMLDAAEDASIEKKVTRSDDAKVPVYLWNMRIRGFDSEELRDKAAKGFRLFGMRLFLLGIWQDCSYHLSWKYGIDQDGAPR